MRKNNLFIVMGLLIISFASLAFCGDSSTRNTVSIFSFLTGSGLLAWAFYLFKRRKKIAEWKDVILSIGNLMGQRNMKSIYGFVKELDEALEATADMCEEKGDKKRAKMLRDIIRLENSEKII